MSLGGIEICVYCTDDYASMVRDPWFMDEAELGQVGHEAANVYEDFFVPALFGQWPEQLLDLVGVDAGMRVLDVGCGTGVLARAALDRAGSGGSVVGLDLNAGMLAVARQVTDEVEWAQGAVEDLDYRDGEFDRVLSQFALMFFADQQAGLAQMSRVGAPGSPTAIATWAALDLSPGYAAMVDLLDRLFGQAAADAMRAPFVLGQPEQVDALVSAHFDDVIIHQLAGTARFNSLEAWMHTDVRGWTLADMISDDEFEVLMAQARHELAGFATKDGSIEFAAPALVATGHCRGART